MLRVSGVLKHLQVQHYEKGKVIFKEGDKGEVAYLLEKGKVQISRNVDGKTKAVANLGPVTIFGEMALFLEDGKRTATATVVEDAEIVILTKEGLEQLMMETPASLGSIFRVFAQRLKNTTQMALKYPRLDLAVAHMLHLFTLQGQTALDHQTLLEKSSSIFNAKLEQVQKAMDSLKKVDAIKVDEAAGSVTFSADSLKNYIALQQ
jgi:CRP-like cAMP-binding protein